VGKDSHSNNAKKIKTESGSWISASYKSNRYKAWKEKSKVDKQRDAEDNDDDDNDQISRKGPQDANRKPTFSKKPVGNNSTSRGAVEKKSTRFKSEIRRPEQILKTRKDKEKKLMQKSKGKKGKKGKGNKGGFSGGGKKKFDGGGKNKGKGKK